MQTQAVPYLRQLTIITSLFHLRVGADWVPEDDFHPEETDTVQDYEKNQFLDLRRPMLWQLLQANFSKSYYLQQVHQPRHLSESAPLFGPAYLEVSRR